MTHLPSSEVLLDDFTAKAMPFVLHLSHTSAMSILFALGRPRR